MFAAELPGSKDVPSIALQFGQRLQRISQLVVGRDHVLGALGRCLRKYIVCCSCKYILHSRNGATLAVKWNNTAFPPRIGNGFLIFGEALVGWLALTDGEVND